MPKVSVVVPCYNEQETIGLLLKAIGEQDYPLDKLEVVIADGLSTDRTRDVITEHSNQYPQLNVQIVDNPKRIIPAGVNTAIMASEGEVIIRLDAHSMPYPDYVSRCVYDLQEKLGDNVGGQWEIKPGGDTWQAVSIAEAARHPLAVGDARYRVGGKAQAVDTVPFGAYYRTLIDRVGLLDESLETNEDYEFNARIRKAGGTVWFDPSIRSVYFSRGDLTSLARQYWRYGYWKMRMLRRHPKTFRWRQLAGVFVLSLLVLALLGLLIKLAWWLLLLEIGIYTIILIGTGVQLAMKKKNASLALGGPLAIATMHFSWGTGFLWGLVNI